jgi:hypothetical protein
MAPGEKEMEINKVFVAFKGQLTDSDGVLEIVVCMLLDLKIPHINTKTYKITTLCFESVKTRIRGTRRMDEGNWERLGAVGLLTINSCLRPCTISIQNPTTYSAAGK